MRNRFIAAITYGVVSLLFLGLALGLTFSGSPATEGMWTVFSLIQFTFFAFSVGYTNGREDEQKR